jgi:hypothetical protein
MNGCRSPLHAPFNAEPLMTETDTLRLQQIDEEIRRLERDYAHREAYGDAGPKLQQLLRSIAQLRHEREALTGAHHD